MTETFAELVSRLSLDYQEAEGLDTLEFARAVVREVLPGKKAPFASGSLGWNAYRAEVLRRIGK